MRCHKWITAGEIDNWADSPQAKNSLPELLRRLVYATVSRKNLLKIDFPAGGEIHRPGYDGTTATQENTPFVPEGVCLWEISCDANPNAKSQRDYEKRVEEHYKRRAEGETENLSEATYVAVTARDWQDGKKWANERTKQSVFKEVRAYDSNSLEQWIQDAPAVGLWMMQITRGRCDGVWDLESYWQNVQGTLQRSLPPEVLLVNRDSIKTEFEKWLECPGNEMAIKGPSPAEVVAVFCAWVRTLPADRQDDISSRVIIVENRETWFALATSQQPLILVAAPRLEWDAQLLAEAKRQGHHVLHFADFRMARTSGGHELPIMRRFDLEATLRNAGIPETEARQLAKAAGGNFTILQRRFPGASTQAPPWAQDGDLAPLLLAAAWKNDCPADKEIVSKLAGREYPKIQETVAKWRSLPDPPIRLSLETWSFLSPLDAWENLHPLLTSTHMDRFQQMVVEVLTEDDPAFDLPASERYMAAIKGKVRRFSPALRCGIAEMLALVTTREQESGIASELHFADKARAIIRQILPNGVTWKRWASLGELLSLLMEAVPDEVLGAMQRDLDSNNSQLVELLHQEVPGVLIGAAYHSGMLWSLETAAWSPNQIVSATQILTRLTELDPGGTWINRPKASAGSIFFSKRPQTMASLDERIKAFEHLVKKEPKGAWKLLISLLPTTVGDFIINNPKPSYRNWAAGWTGQPDESENITFLSMLVEKALLLVKAEPANWVEFIDHIACLRNAELQQVVIALENVNRDDFSSNIRLSVWEKLRKLVQDHTYFSDAWWALPSQELARFDHIMNKFGPDDLVTASVYLFADDGHMEGEPDEPYEAKTERRNQQRRQVTRAIWNDKGLSAILDLAQKVRQSYAVGIALAQELGAMAQPQILPSLLSHENESVRQMAHYFGMQRIFDEGHDWAERQISDDWTDEQVGLFATLMPFIQRTWDWVTSKGKTAADVYWRETDVRGGINLNLADSERAIKELLLRQRGWRALGYLTLRIYSKQPVAPATACDVLEAIASQTIAEPRKDFHDVHRVVEFLQQQPQTDENRLAKIEFAFLFCLDRYSCLPLTLQRLLAKNPKFFVECLEVLYRPRHRDKGALDEEKAPPDPLLQAKAERIWNLLHDWQVIPGTESNGISEVKLKAWVDAARQLAKEVDRLEVCENTIGQLFARSGEDTDGARPAVAVRNVMENCLSESMRSGFSTGLLNLRGVVNKGLYEGGNQERNLANKFRNYAQICAQWRNVASVHKSVSEYYIRQAEQEDEEANARD
jgi:hypothetical protein